MDSSELNQPLIVLNVAMKTSQAGRAAERGEIEECSDTYTCIPLPLKQSRFCSLRTGSASPQDRELNVRQIFLVELSRLIWASI